MSFIPNKESSVVCKENLSNMSRKTIDNLTTVIYRHRVNSLSYFFFCFFSDTIFRNIEEFGVQKYFTDYGRANSVICSYKTKFR